MLSTANQWSSNVVIHFVRNVCISWFYVILVKKYSIKINLMSIILLWRCWQRKEKSEILTNWSKFALLVKVQSEKHLLSQDSKENNTSNTPLQPLVMILLFKIELLMISMFVFNSGIVPDKKDIALFLLFTIKVTIFRYRFWYYSHSLWCDQKWKSQ